MDQSPLNWTNDVALPAEWGQDQRLSYPARGILAELVNTPPEGEMSVERLERIGAWGDAWTIEAHLHELERCGYLRRTTMCWFLFDPHPFPPEPWPEV